MTQHKRFEPTWESVTQHRAPAWFEDAKLGIFIHWGLYSVPAWAPTTGELTKVVAEEGWESWFTNNPYAEWYLNSIRIPDSPSHQHHIQTYGDKFSYDDFVPLFNQSVQQWDPGAWAALFRDVGARYVVLTTKHHDGFLLWPSQHPNPFKRDYFAHRDLVGELTEAVRSAGMRMGLYYSGGLDWTFNPVVIKDIADMIRAIPQQPDYVRYANNHWYELIARYEPSILWNDIAYPAAADLASLFAHYYNTVAEGAVNDRFTQEFNFAATDVSEMMKSRHFDFRTPEYASFDTITRPKWEATRGIGFSFGYNQNEGPEAYLSVRELVHSFVDIVSKNGNLLLNVGPMADGTIPALQRERLEGLGTWLRRNGEAIFDTCPWVTAEGTTGDGLPLRFTQKRDTLYAIVLAQPQPGELLLKDLMAPEGAQLQLLGYAGALPWRQSPEGITVALPQKVVAELGGDTPAFALSITPSPALRD